VRGLGWLALLKRLAVGGCGTQVKGPLVNCFFTLATEARDTDYSHRDDGLPHTLEHLIFMGTLQLSFAASEAEQMPWCIISGEGQYLESRARTFAERHLMHYMLHLTLEQLVLMGAPGLDDLVLYRAHRSTAE
jgi:hypothetical protein